MCIIDEAMTYQALFKKFNLTNDKLTFSFLYDITQEHAKNLGYKDNWELNYAYLDMCKRAYGVKEIET